MTKAPYFFAVALLVCTLSFTAKAQLNKADNSKTVKKPVNTVCFNDGFYNWSVTYTDQGSGYYTAKGTVNVDGTNWIVAGYGNFVKHAGNVELHVTNPNPDGCWFYTDSFTYAGNAQITGTGSGTKFTGSGTWTSYCFDDIFNTGSWSASGPCSSTLRSLPYGPAKHYSPNLTDAKKPVNTVCFNDGFYNWSVTYTDKGSGYYTATGTVNVDGINWPVSGYGNFAKHAGNVELHVTNPNPDGCWFYTDSFTYAGNAQITGTGSGTKFTGSGTWTSYCFNDVFNTGSWSASGPCSSTLRSLPYGPAKHNAPFSLKVSPNPLKSSSTVTYNLAKESKVNITVYNYMQQPVKVLVNKTESAGKHTYVLDARSSNGIPLQNGIYRIVSIVDGNLYTTSLQVVR